MRVLLANKFFHLKGGSESVFFGEREGLGKRGIEIVDFSMDDAQNAYSPYSGHFVSKIDYEAPGSLATRIRTAASLIHSAEAVAKITALVEQHKPHIAHLHNIYHQFTPSIIPALKKRGVKVVMTLHDGKLICPTYTMLSKGEICTACGGRWFWKSVLKDCQESLTRSCLLAVEAYWHKWAGSYEGVDVFLAPSQFLANLCLSRMPKDKVRVLYNGIDTSDLGSAGSDRGYALYFGRLSREKGVETLLRAHSDLHETIPLKVVGGGPLEDRLRRDYPHADFVGYRKGQALKDIVAHCSFVVVPSEWYENCPMVVLEAMGAGKTVLASRIGGIPEILTESETGMLFTMGSVSELREKLFFLWQNVDLRRQMGQSAREKVEREFSLDAHLTRLIGVYSELIS